MFLSVVRDGWPKAQHSPPPIELTDLLPSNEIQRVIAFGIFMSKLSGGARRFQEFDKKITEAIVASNDLNQQMDLLGQFFDESQRVLAEIHPTHVRMNASLGRLPIAPELGLGDLWTEYGTHTQDIIEIE